MDMKRLSIGVLLSLVLSCLIVFTPQNAIAKPLKNCGSASTKNSRVLENVVCKDGSPNLAATKKLKFATPQMMKLKRNSTMHQIYLAICKDWTDNTGPDLMVTYEYLSALYDWKDAKHLDVYSNYPDCDTY